MDRASYSQFGTSLRLAQRIFRHEGFTGGFYRGLLPNLLGNSVSWALYFFWYSRIKTILAIHASSGDLSYYDFFTASGIAGMLRRVPSSLNWPSLIYNSQELWPQYAPTQYGLSRLGCYRAPLIVRARIDQWPMAPSKSIETRVPEASISVYFPHYSAYLTAHYNSWPTSSSNGIVLIVLAGERRDWARWIICGSAVHQRSSLAVQHTHIRSSGRDCRCMKLVKLTLVSGTPSLRSGSRRVLLGFIRDWDQTLCEFYQVRGSHFWFMKRQKPFCRLCSTLERWV